jgi:hypothetical protein
MATAGAGLPPRLLPGAGAGSGRPAFPGSGRPLFGGSAGPVGGAFGTDGSLKRVLSYVRQHGAGTIAVSSQASAATAIIAADANVAGIGGFSGRESDVSVSWLAHEVRSGKIRWLLAGGEGPEAVGPGLPGDTRAGSKAAMAAVARACLRVTLRRTTLGAGASTSTPTGAIRGATRASTLYDCQGRAEQLQSAGARQSGG